MFIVTISSSVRESSSGVSNRSLSSLLFSFADKYQEPSGRRIANVPVPVIASGGGGTPQHLADELKEGKAEEPLIATMVHSGKYTVGSIKDELKKFFVDNGSKRIHRFTAQKARLYHDRVKQ